MNFILPRQCSRHSL